MVQILKQKSKKNEIDNPRFAFLKMGNPYYAYYQQRVRDIRSAEGIVDPAVEKSIKDAAMEKIKLKKRLLGEEEPMENGEGFLEKQLIPKSAKDERPNELLESPPSEEWVLESPKVSALELDIMKLAAQFVARNGRQFQIGLLNREYKNSQFDFLKAIHPYHTYFQKLVESYTKVLLPPRDIVSQLKNNAADKREIIDRMMKRVQWERAQIKTQQELEAEQEKEREAMSLIDWHDFVVVETITFDDEISLPPPEKLVTEPPKQVDESDTMEVEMDTEMEIEPKVPPEPEKPLQIRTDYNKRTRSLAEQRSTKFQVCPKCGQEIPVEEMEEHMKIELSNPDLIRRNLNIRNQGSSLARGSEIAENLVGFAAKRTDIFGEEEVELGRQVGADEDEERKKLQKVTWDGHTSSIQRTAQEALGGKTLQDQIALIHASKGLTKAIEQQPTIGPRIDPIQKANLPAGQPQSQQQPPSGRPPMPFPQGPAGFPPGFMPHPMSFPPGFPAFLQQPSFGGLPPHMRPGPPLGSEPPTKKQKLDEKSFDEPKLVPEAEWKAQHPGPVRLLVRVPKVADKSDWFLNGQALEITLEVTKTVKDLKKEISKRLNNMPTNKQKVKVEGQGFFKDKFSLAYYNIKDGTDVTDRKSVV